jgi:hypothetical protein
MVQKLDGSEQSARAGEPRYVSQQQIELLFACAHGAVEVPRLKKKFKRTYNSGYSLVVTDPTTNPPISSLSTAERTGCPVFLNLWSYVITLSLIWYMHSKSTSRRPQIGATKVPKRDSGFLQRPIVHHTAFQKLVSGRGERFADCCDENPSECCDYDSQELGTCDLLGKNHQQYQ